MGGEISNLATPSSGHWYFTLKDGNAQVRCAMFRNRNQRLRFTPEQGDEVRVRCRVSLYEGRGEFQLIVEHLELAGAGALHAAFDKLKAKLQAEGLFDAARKRALPEHVARLGVITSPTGAALHDILTVLRRRAPSIEVYVLPVPVQGDGAAQQIAATIERADRWHREGRIDLDALIVGRGGGSLEDLWAFNEEVVARAIADCALPVVSAVGHEVDFSIADMVADQRAPTPSAAAEMLSQDQRVWRQQLTRLQGNLVRLMQARVAAASVQLRNLSQRLQHPGARLREQAQRIDDFEQRLILAQNNLLHRYRAEIRLLDNRLRSASPLPRLRRLMGDTRQQRRALEAAMRRRLADAGKRLEYRAQLLDSLSPLATLQRGYAILSDSSGAVLTDPRDVAVGDSVQAHLAGGTSGPDRRSPRAVRR
ncbi:MAG: exodeoxyribonuclease VII large subunit [Halioglobus sp.]|nr:exodeoxyribonuclease VII large subunit [Halioglobus sp.]